MFGRLGERAGDSLGLVLILWSIPAAILVVGTPIVMALALVMALVRWILQ